DRAADRELTDRSGAPDRDGILGLDVALDGCLPAGGKDVAQEQELLVGQPRGYLDMGGVRERHAQIFGLSARIAAGEVGVAEQACRRMAEDLLGNVLVAVGALADREIAAPALVAFAADDGEGNDDPVSR